MKRLLRISILVMALSLAHVSPVQGVSLPDSAYVIGVNGQAQSYVISCESRSAADLAAFWGVNIGESEFLEALPRADNPNNGFVGDPNDPWGRIPPQGYGVHADPVAETLQQFGLGADARDGLSWDDLRTEISAGRPVIVWVIGKMWEGTPVKYEAADGSSVTVAAFEHTMILTGYTSTSVQVVDASTGEYGYYRLESFLKSWAVLGNMAVFGPPEASSKDELQPESSDYVESQAETQDETYTVQPGEYLIQLARRFGVSWQELAELNSVRYPFVLFPGQVLQLPRVEVTGEQAASPVKMPREGSYRVDLPVVTRNFVTPVIQGKAPKALAGFDGSTLFLPFIIHPDQLPGLR